MTRLKRILSLALCLVMLASMLPAAHAEEEAKENNVAEEALPETVSQESAEAEIPAEEGDPEPSAVPETTENAEPQEPIENEPAEPENVEPQEPVNTEPEEPVNDDPVVPENEEPSVPSGDEPVVPDSEEPAVVTVITVEKQPEDLRPAEGKVIFSVTASVNTEAALTFQWQRLDMTVTYLDEAAREEAWEDLPGKTASELEITGLEDEAALAEAMKYAWRCKLAAGDTGVFTGEVHVLEPEIQETEPAKQDENSDITIEGEEEETEAIDANQATVYTVTLNANGGRWYNPNTTTKTFSVTAGSSLDLMNMEFPSNDTDSEHYYCVGWCLTPQCNGEVFQYSYTPTKNVTLYAKWEFSYTLTLVTSYGGFVVSYSDEPVSEVYIAYSPGSVAQPYNVFDIYYPSTQKIIEGWYYDQAFTRKATSGNGSIVVNNDMTLYAKWTNAPVNLTLSSINSSYDYLDRIEFTISLKNSSGTPVGNQGEMVYIVDQKGNWISELGYQSGAWANTSRKVVMCLQSEDLAAGNYKIVVEVDYEDVVLRAEKSFYYTADKSNLPDPQSCRISLTVEPSTVHDGEELSAMALITDSAGNPVKRVIVWFIILDQNGNEIEDQVWNSSISGADGKCGIRYPFPQNIPAGTYTLKAKIDGTSKTASKRFQYVGENGAETLNKTELSLTVNQKYTLKVTNSSGGTVSATWSTSDSSIATVSSSGVVTAKKPGTATITAKRSNGTVIGTCSVRVLFTDVKDSSRYYYQPVYWALDNGITTGAGGVGLFSPDADCTREQIVTFLWRLFGSPEPTEYTQFTDVPTSAWYYKPICWAAEKGITVGLNDGTGRFGVGQPCTRAMCVTFLWRAAGKPTPHTQGNFTDMKPGAYYVDAVSWAAENGITVGLNDGTGRFGINNNCTRAMIVTFLYRFAHR